MPCGLSPGAMLNPMHFSDMQCIHDAGGDGSRARQNVAACHHSLSHDAIERSRSDCLFQCQCMYDMLLQKHNLIIPAVGAQEYHQARRTEAGGRRGGAGDSRPKR